MLKVLCNHWTPAATPTGGRCGLGKYGGTPSLGLCANHCTECAGEWRDKLRADLAAAIKSKSYLTKPLDPLDPSDPRNFPAEGCKGCGG